MTLNVTEKQSQFSLRTSELGANSRGRGQSSSERWLPPTEAAVLILYSPVVVDEMKETSLKNTSVLHTGSKASLKE